MKKAVMYGAGNIGRGFIGQLLSQSGYEVVFIDVVEQVVNRLNRDKKYPVRIVSHDGYVESIVDNVRCVNGLNENEVAKEIADCDLMATAVGVNVLKHIAKPVAKGLMKRWQDKNFKPLNIIICENLLDADLYIERLIKESLDEESKKIFDQTVGLVKASIGRMVPVMTDEMKAGNPLRVWAEPYNELPVDKSAFKGEIPAIKNMLPFAPFDFYIQRKLFMHNMGHAVTAYLGFIDKLEYIWEAIGSTYIKMIANKALEESASAMAKAHGVPLKKLLEHADDLVYRFGNKLLGDTIARVGKDPVRKLSPNDRLGGSLKFCIENGVLPVYTSVGAAAGLMYENQKDPATLEIRAFIDEYGIERAVEKYCGALPESHVFDMIVTFYRMFDKGAPIKEVYYEAEKYKDNVLITF